MKKNLFQRGIRVPIRLHKILLTMKLTGLFVLLICLQASASSFAQSNRISLNTKGVSIKNIFKSIEEQSDYTLFYRTNDIDLNKKIAIKVSNQLVTKTLDEVLENTGLTYTVKDKIIVIRSTDSAIQASKRTLKGLVVDDGGMPLPGVSVFVKGTTLGTTTNIDGEFNLVVGETAQILAFSFVGMEKKEVEIGTNLQFKVTLEPSAIDIEEIVAVGYGTQKKVNITGSIASVKTESLHAIPASNLSNTMAGRAPGVKVVNSSGLAGASSSIRMRGSFVDPLYVINGVISSKRDFDALDANEVESINFLKDAASASIYGSQAGDGVVLITTKGGGNKKARFEYRNSFSTARTTRPIQSFTATEELNYVNHMMETKGQPMPYGQEVFDYFENRSYDINDLIWQNPSVQKHNLSVNGGSEKIQYYLSLGYHDEEGSYKNLNYNRYNFRSDVTTQITKRFKVNVNLSGNQQDYSRWYWPYDGAEDFNVSDFYRATFNTTRLYPFYVDEAGKPTNNPNDIPVKSAGGYHVPELVLNGGSRDIIYKTFNGIIKFDLDLGDFVEGLTTKFVANYTIKQKQNKGVLRHNKWYIFQGNDVENRFKPSPIDPNQKGVHNLGAKYDALKHGVDLSTSYQLNWFLQYDRTFDNHHISALAVYERGKNDGSYYYGQVEDPLSRSNEQIYNYSGDTEKRWFSGREWNSAIESYIGRFNYTYADKYIAQFSFRYDGNYRFAPEKRWGMFPSVSLGWRITEEAFLKNVDWLSNLKLRGSYGTTGSARNHKGQTIGAWQWANNYHKSKTYVFGSNLYDGLAPGKMPNLDITWATQKAWNIGVEYGFFNNHLTGEIEAWGKNVSDILAPRVGSTPSTLGASLPDINYAENSYNGIELNISWQNRIGELKYSVYANMGYAVDKWEKFDEAEALTDGTYANNWRSRIGKPRNRIMGYKYVKMLRTQADIDELPEGFTQFGRAPKLGTLLFADIRGENYSEGADGKIDGNDYTYLSDNGAPRIDYGFGVNLEWKNFTFDAHFQGVGKYDRMIRSKNSGGAFQVDRPYFAIWAKDYWTPENPNAKLPRIGGMWTAPEYGGNSSTFWLRNGAYLRLKNLNFGYNLPKQWFAPLGLEKVNLFVNGTNLFFISALKEHDPEQATLDSYPVMKTFSGGLIINF